MSRVTNLVLCLGVFDADGVLGKIEEVNRYFEGSSTGLVSVDDPSLPRGWYGGGKYLEAELYVGAYNHLDLNAFYRPTPFDRVGAPPMCAVARPGAGG